LDGCGIGGDVAMKVVFLRPVSWESYGCGGGEESGSEQNDALHDKVSGDVIGAL